jgi:hypothetical protein
MLGSKFTHALATVAVTAGVLVAAGPASAAYQHNQTDLEFAAAVTDGTSNTISFGERAGFLMTDMGGQFG